jgi:ribosomal protein S18 acetylase RimI-like enzyme
MTWFERSCVERIVPRTWGVGLFHEDFPKVYMLNFVRLNDAADLSLLELLAEVDELHREAGCEHRDMLVEDESLGEALAPEFRRLGWQVSRLLLMSYRGDRNLPLVEEIRELTATELRNIRSRAARVGPSAEDPETIAQLIDKDTRLARAGGARFFGAVVGDSTMCSADLYSDGSTAQIESVLTLEPYRRRGLGRAVVTEALRAAFDTGHDFVFLIAEDNDWPKELYGRMGFEPLGRSYEFLKTRA